MKKNKKILIGLICLFVVLLGTTLFVSFSSNLDVQEVIVKSITPVYDETSDVIVDNENVVFNDKNQVVDYKVVIENTQDYDVKITDIKLSTPTEEFLQYTVEDISKDDILVANSTKELMVSFETMRIEGWGRNFQDELTANISFEMVPKNEESTSSPEVNDKEYDSTEDEPNTDNNEDTTEDNSSEKEDLNDENEVTKPNTDNNTQNDSKDDNVAENPYTNTGELILYIAVTGISVVVIFVLKNKKVNKYLILAFILSSSLSFVKAENQIELSISFDVSFKSQNVMKPSGFEWDSSNYELLSDNYGADYWAYAMQIENLYIQNEILEIDEYAYEFDVTEANNGRVMAYLVERNNDSFCYNFDWEEDVCYDLYLQADGIIYPNENASYYFAAMEVLGEISNLSGIDTSEVTDMRGMFSGTGSSVEFTLDVSNFDTSNVTDMSYMFENVGAISENLILDLSNFNTSNVTNMSSMFTGTGTNSAEFTLDVSNFNTSNVTDMSSMFNSTGYSSSNFTLDLSNFDTSNVTDMSYMFYLTGGMSEMFTLDVSSFDTSNVTNMSRMFEATGGISEIFTLDVSNFDTSNVTDMSYMFDNAGYSSANLNISLTIKNPNTNVYHIFDNTALEEGSKIKVNYTNKTKGIANRIVDSKSEGANIVLGEMVETIEDDGELSIGEEVEINGEYFNVVSQNEDTVTLLAQYNLGTDYKQSSVQNDVKFADTYGWEYTPGPKEIDIQTWSTNPKIYVNEYIEYLKEELGDGTVTGDLITLKDLEELGCTVPSDYGWGSGGWNCYDSSYGWIVNDQNWWTRSADSTNSGFVWYVYNDGYLFYDHYYDNFGVRPVIIISKETLRNLG